MSKKIIKKNLGFTLIELLVVISIIGLLSTVILVSLKSAKDKANNSTINSIAMEYTKAIEFALDANDEYPNPGVGDVNMYCLGEGYVGGAYTDNQCGLNVTRVQNAAINSALAPFFSHLPKSEILNPSSTLGATPVWKGFHYRCSGWTATGQCNAFQLRWVLKNYADCIAGASHPLATSNICSIDRSL
ncbi:hypothetical protein A2442_03455 [Candidatus Campbellbacteria bacterium RIFOXYC2_FULL_35_25]|uniref:Type II secretion system protein GspG C-terminal domain-containing protein n=1 Tax=Candidatus Campbellbacteria bacterium RIFOXYC2_FULL_35_25 TaxID=1797582 RepID=A0A1F5EHS5_9BACT|nr:MAG: hypothetical protein A2442_03455 [Candidatus Campbellbacteria bacterium RIFOXYC2_FULL_35_25]